MLMGKSWWESAREGESFSLALEKDGEEGTTGARTVKPFLLCAAK